MLSCSSIVIDEDQGIIQSILRSAGPVCPEMADKANPGAAASSTLRTYVRWCGILGARCSQLSPRPFLLSMGSSLVLCCPGALGDDSAPGRAVCGAGLPGLSVDVEVLERGFQAVFKSLFLATDRTLAPGELTIEELLWNAGVWHACDVACPSDLSHADHGDNIREPCLLQDFSVWDSVLPSDVKDV